MVDVPPAMTRAYKWALVCGALPLVVGIAIFVAWLVTGWEQLQVFGIVWLYVGMGVFGIGVFALGRFWWLASKNSKLPAKQVKRRVVTAACLLVVNFPVAGAVMTAAYLIESSFLIEVHNEGQHALEDIRIKGGGCDLRLGTVGPGGAVKQRFWIQQDGELELTAVSAGEPVAETVSGYVSYGTGGHARVSVGDDRRVVVELER